mgnify:FL=1
MNKWIILIGLTAMVSGCQWNGDESDAFGQFQATEVQVSVQHRGQLRALNVQEGNQLAAGDTVGWVDTTELVTQKNELEARLEAARSRLPSIKAEQRVLESELQVAQNDLNRLEALMKEDAATQKQLDDARGRVNVLKRKIEAVRVNRQSARAEIQALKSRLQTVEVQLKNALVINPQKGTVLTKYKEPGEVVQYGQPVYKVADLDTMELRVYVSGAQLSKVKLGQNVRVLIDDGPESYQELPGTVRWIASEAEFTPQMIQTKEERVSQVYAVDVHVPNDGRLKIGMPGEVRFGFKP